MSSFFDDVRQNLVPDRDSRHGPLPPLLIAMTVVTGLIDAFSYLVLGHVFVANMTGNVIFLGFALAGAPGFSIGASLMALVAFVLGALIGGTVGARLGDHRGRLLSATAAIQCVLLAASLIITTLSESPIPDGSRYALIVILSVAMGIQNAAARKLAVPDLTTTVLTLTITGMAADSRLVGGKGSQAGRRLLAVAALLLGALIGANFIVHASPIYPLVIALIVTITVTAVTWILATSDPAWIRVDGARS